MAGRAGRYGSRYPSGTVTALSAEDLGTLAAALQAPSEPLATAFVFPSLPQLELLHGQFPRVSRRGAVGVEDGWCAPGCAPGAALAHQPRAPRSLPPTPQDSLPQLLDRFAAAAAGSLLGTHYELARYAEIRTLATMLKHLPLSLREAWQFAISPTDPADAHVAAALLGFATAYAARRRVTPASVLLPPCQQAARSELELQQLEAAHRVLDLFVWLAYRMPDAFEGMAAVAAQRERMAALIDESLRAMGAPRCASAGDWARAWVAGCCADAVAACQQKRPASPAPRPSPALPQGAQGAATAGALC